MKTTLNSDSEQRRLSEKLNLETAKMPWAELQTFFATGVVIKVATSLDLLQVAEQLVADNADLVAEWMQDGSVSQVSDEQAHQWFEQESELWTVVIKPWVLVQQADS